MREREKTMENEEQRKLPDDYDFPFIDIGVINETCRTPRFGVFLYFLP
jgi:hypothetical protein